MKRAHQGFGLVGLAGLLAYGAMVTVACTGDDGAITSVTPDGSVGPVDGGGTTPADAAQTPTDGGTQDPVPDAGFEDITDGGGLPPDEEDGGLTDPDGGFDGGVACDPLAAGAYVETSCLSRVAILTGGELVSASYQLASVTVVGSATFCGVGGEYKPYMHRGALKVVATSPTTATFEFLDQYRRSGGLIRPTTNRYDVSVAAASSKLTYTAQSCAIKPPPAGGTYSAGVDAETGKKRLRLRLPYGTGNAIFTYLEI